MRTDRLRVEHNVSYTWTVFPLHQEIPEEGVEIVDYFGGKGYDLDAMQERLVRVAAQEGLPIGNRKRISNARRAQELGKFAEQLGLLEKYQRLVYHAYFVDGKNIAQMDELLEICGRLDIPRDEARTVLEEGRFSAAVDADHERARDLGVTGVPAFVYRDRLMVGFVHYADFVRFIEKW